MEFRIADTFTDSLGRLTAQEQRAVKTTAFDLQMDSSAPGLSFHKLDRAKDTNFWSVRVNADIRLIVHRTSSSVLLVYVGHHDAAYKWAERRKIEQHPTTGAMQLVEVRERVQDVEIFQPKVVELAPAIPKPLLFDNLRKMELMSFGVPEEWVEDVRKADEDTIFDIIGHLPQEAQEALLKLAVGEKPQPPEPTPASSDAFSHPDAQRRFRVLKNVGELRRALDFPWEKWAVFLHPAQQQLVERSFAGPARVSGSAGTGKTIVAIHRAVHLARANPNARVLLTTFSKILASSLSAKVNQLVGNETQLANRIAIRPITAVGQDLYSELFGQPSLASEALIGSLLEDTAKAMTVPYSYPFLLSEWRDVVDAWQIGSWDEYADVQRLGRKTRIGLKQREVLWRVFERVRAALAERQIITWAGLFGRLTVHFGSEPKKPFDYAVVDEAQDLSVAEARFLAKLVSDRPDGLFFAGDLGQRIFQHPFSWRSLGIDVRGRSSTLRINYRTSHQIRLQADRLLPSSVSDVDGNAESRKGTVSVFDGTAPIVKLHRSSDEESSSVGAWIMEQLQHAVKPHEIAVFVRSEIELPRAHAAVKAAGATSSVLDGVSEPQPNLVAVGTMHLAKGLEFKAVAVMACDDEVLPSQERIETVADESDLEEVYDTERHLLYVACTRARDHLLVSGVLPGSEFLKDLQGKI